MTLTILGSSSAGNCYLFDDGNDILMLECGIPFRKVQQSVDFNIGRIVACLVSHEHGDHAKAAKDVLKARIPIYASQGTIDALGLIRQDIIYSVKEMEAVKLERFTVFPFSVQHDAAQPFGYLIQHPDMGLTVFATDTYYLKYKFAGLNNIMIECNYRKDILDDNIAKGLIPSVVRDRTLTSHLEFETCKEILLANDLTAVNNIILMHLSGNNSDARAFQADMQQAVAHNVMVARKGMVINFDKTPF